MAHTVNDTVIPERFGDSYVLRYERVGGSVRRIHRYVPRDGEPSSVEGVWVTDTWDLSPQHSSYTAYNSRCTHCYLNHSHSTELHNVNVKGA
jgi:hypothetical protein